MSVISLTFGIVLFALLTIVAVIDVRTMRIPNLLNGAIATVGIIFLWFEAHGLFFWHMGSAVLITVALYLVREAFIRFKGKDGLGQGDIKMFGASALWIAPWNLSLMLFIASCSALAFIVWRTGAVDGPSYSERLPFGPFIGLAMFITWIWQEI